MNLELCECTSGYWEFVRDLRIDPINQKGFFTLAEITKEQQIEYMIKNQGRYKVCLLDSIPVGYIGLIGSSEITYCVLPNFSGMGIGTYMVEEFTKNMKSIEAYVKPKNIASQRVFEKLGWEKQIYFKKSKFK